MGLLLSLKDAWRAAGEISKNIDAAHDALPPATNAPEMLERGLDKGMGIVLKGAAYAAAPLVGVLRHAFHKAATGDSPEPAAPKPIEIQQPFPKNPGL